MRPTRRHQPVLTFGILGTVYGISPTGEVKYFDYDWDAAIEWADLEREDTDLRFAPAPRAYTLPGYDMWHPERRVRRGERAYFAIPRGVK